MKKNRTIKKILIGTIIIIVLSILVYLCYPKYIGKLADGGSDVWEAKLYTLIKWNKIDNREPKGWRIYFWPNKDKAR